MQPALLLTNLAHLQNQSARSALLQPFLSLAGCLTRHRHCICKVLLRGAHVSEARY